MKNTKKRDLLTSELYEKISGAKIKKIAHLKEYRTTLTGRIDDEISLLAELKAQKAEINSKIKLTCANLSTIKNKRFKIIRELGKQEKLANKLNKLATKTEAYVEVNKFYPEDKPKKR